MSPSAPGRMMRTFSVLKDLGSRDSGLRKVDEISYHYIILFSTRPFFRDDFTPFSYLDGTQEKDNSTGKPFLLMTRIPETRTTGHGSRVFLFTFTDTVTVTDTDTVTSLPRSRPWQNTSK